MFDLKPNAPGEDPRRVQADRHQRAGHPDLRAPAADGPVDAQDGPGPLGQPQGGLPQPAAQLHRLRDRAGRHHQHQGHLSAQHGLGLRVPAQATQTTCPPTSTCPTTRARATPAAWFATPGRTPASSASATTRSSPSSTRPTSARSGSMKVLGGEPFLARNSRLADGITLDALQTREGLLAAVRSPAAPAGSRPRARRRQPHPAAGAQPADLAPSSRARST